MRNLDNQKDLIIMSVTRPGLSAQEQRDARDEVLRLLNTCGYIEHACAAEARFMGEPELSVVAVVKPGNEAVAMVYILELAEEYGQESILLRDGQGVWLVTTDEGAQQRIGDNLIQHTDSNTLPDNCTILRDVVWVAK